MHHKRTNAQQRNPETCPQTLKELVSHGLACFCHVQSTQFLEENQALHLDDAAHVLDKQRSFFLAQCIQKALLLRALLATTAPARSQIHCTPKGKSFRNAVAAQQIVMRETSQP